MGATNQKAYFIAGHGSTIREYFIVPPGCTIVFKTHIGEQGFASVLSDNIKQFCNIDKLVWSNPSNQENLTQLVDTFGSLAIYTEGQLCPNSFFSLLSYFPENSKCLRYSGVIDLDALETDICTEFEYNRNAQRTDLFKDIECSDLDLFKNDFIFQYNYSVFPTLQNVEKVFSDKFFNETIPKFNIPHTNLDSEINPDDKKKALEFVEWLLKEYKLITVKQSELCSRFKGVFYNFVCRVDYGSNIAFEQNKNSLIPRQIPTNMFYNSPYFKSLQKARIAEAEWHRKQGIRDSRFNKEPLYLSGGKRFKSRIRNNVYTRKTKRYRKLI
jgi:hypothetical protein